MMLDDMLQEFVNAKKQEAGDFSEFKEIFKNASNHMTVTMDNMNENLTMIRHSMIYFMIFSAIIIMINLGYSIYSQENKRKEDFNLK